MNNSIFGMNHSRRYQDALDGDDTSAAAEIGKRAARLVVRGYLPPDFSRGKDMAGITSVVVGASCREYIDTLVRAVGKPEAAKVVRELLGRHGVICEKLERELAEIVRNCDLPAPRTIISGGEVLELDGQTAETEMPF